MASAPSHLQPFRPSVGFSACGRRFRSFSNCTPPTYNHQTPYIQLGNTGLFRLYPLVPLCVSLAAGILAGRSMATMVGMTVWAAAFGVAFTAALLLGGRPKAQTAAILLSVLLLGCAMSTLAERRQSVSLPQGETAFEAIVADEPVERGRTLRFDAIACSGPLKGHWVRLTLLKDTVERRYATLGVGDGMLVRSRLVPPANYRE